MVGHSERQVKAESEAPAHAGRAAIQSGSFQTVIALRSLVQALKVRCRTRWAGRSFDVGYQGPSGCVPVPTPGFGPSNAKGKLHHWFPLTFFKDMIIVRNAQPDPGSVVGEAVKSIGGHKKGEAGKRQPRPTD